MPAHEAVFNNFIIRLMRPNCVRRYGALRRESRSCSRVHVKDDRLRFGLVFGGAGVERRNETKRMAEGSP